MKNSRIFIPIAILIIIIGLLITLAVFKSLFRVTTSNKTTPGTSANSSVVSDSQIFFQGPIANASSAPQNIVTDPKSNHGLSVYWIKATGTNANFTCTLYDSNTNQIYATHYQTNGEFSGRSSGSMYYQNTSIKQDKALNLLDGTCFKG